MDVANGFFVYSYQHDDDQQGWTRIEVFTFRELGEHGAPEKASLSPAFIGEVHAALKEGGWEGDGQIGAMMLPPFCSSEVYSHWFPVFHVKQSNNGTSWIASQHPLDMESLTA